MRSHPGRLVAAALVLVAAGAAVAGPAAPAGAASFPPKACKVLTPFLASLYANVQETPTIRAPRTCGYGSAPGDPVVTIALSEVGPVPAETARASYLAARAEAKRLGVLQGLHGFGPKDAFGTEASDATGSSATVTFLSGRWNVQIAISGPPGYGDATVDNLAALLKHHLWRRWS